MNAIRILAASLFMAGSGVAAQVTIFSDDFTGEPNAVILNYNAFQKWTVTQGFVDLLDTSFCGGAPRCVDLDGSGSGTASTMQTINTVNLVEGGFYTFTMQFNTGAEPDAIGALVGVFAFSESSGYLFPHTFSFSFVVGAGQGGAATISITDNNTLNFTGPYVDWVTLEQTVSDVPEPATAGLAACALALAGLLRRRRA